MRLLGLSLALAVPFAGAFFGFTLDAQTYAFTTPVGQVQNNLGVDGTNGNAHFYNPYGIAVGVGGKLFVTDGQAVRQIVVAGTNWMVTTIAGTNNVPGSAGSADGTNGAARFHFPFGLATDRAGNLYVADQGNSTIRKLTASGNNWIVTTIAGGAGTNSFNDGTNGGALFSGPYGLAVDAATNVYVADTGNNVIRRLTPQGTNWVATTLAGSPGASGSRDGTNSVARFTSPAAIAVDSATNLYVADYGSNIIRKLIPAGTNWVVTTLAGLAGSSGAADGTNRAARFNGPLGIAVDAQGSLYVTDAVNNTIRKLTPAGTNSVVTTLAGSASSFGSSDGLGTNALFNNPWGLALDSQGSLYVADNFNYTLRFGQPTFSLQISLAGNQVLVSWPTNAAGAGYLPESCGSLPPASGWSPVTNVGIQGTSFSVTNPATGPAGFYRLRKP